MLALKGKAVADKLSADLIEQIRQLKAQHIQPTLAIVRIGEKADQIAYEKAAQKKAQMLGIETHLFQFAETIDTHALILAIEELNQNPQFHGILLLQPLPSTLQAEWVKNAISPQKDVDCLNETTLGQFFIHYGNQSLIAPCTAEAVMTLLDFYQIELEGKKVVVIGRSLVIGRPLATMLTAKNATVTLCHSKTKEQDLISLCQQADIIISAIGVHNRLPQKAILPHHKVIDVGINIVDGKLKGDFDSDQLAQKVQAYTPVPGGIGTITTTILMKHLVDLCH